MWQGMAVTDLYDLPAYADSRAAPASAWSAAEDLTGRMGRDPEHRLAMYRKLREETQAAGTPAGHDAFYESYVRSSIW